MDGIERGCSETSVTYVHVNVDAWRLGYELEWQKVQARYPQLAPKNLGSMGYSADNVETTRNAYHFHSLDLCSKKNLRSDRFKNGVLLSLSTLPEDMRASQLGLCL